MRIVTLLVCLHTWQGSFSQSINERLSVAINNLEADSQCKHAVVSLYVLDSKKLSVIFARNPEIGLAPASCQKIITSVTAFELLGKDYTYKTSLGYDGKIDNGNLSGDIVITGSGDPTLGSWRYEKTKEDLVLANFKRAIADAGIKSLKGRLKVDNRLWNSQAIPDGWIFQDIGNYYGAGVSSINWRENQYDIMLKSGNKAGDPVKIVSTVPSLIQGVNLTNELTSGEKGSGDNAYIYLPVGSTVGFIRGTIPVNEDRFVVSGAMPDGGVQFKAALLSQIKVSSQREPYTILQPGNPSVHIFFTYVSPSLDSINYWFLKKSINLYGEALVKTIAYETIKYGSTDSGVNVIRDFWSKRGIEKTALNIVDGSGLSPANRITASSLTTVLQFAKNQRWFSSFYDALPVTNGIKMKSGSISGVLSYTGYITSAKGNEYTFAFIINNFNGSGSLLRKKMWKILDGLR